MGVQRNGCSMDVEVITLIFGIYSIISSFCIIIYSIVIIVALLIDPITITNMIPREINQGHIEMNETATSIGASTDFLRFLYDSILPPFMLLSGCIALGVSFLLVVGIQKKRSSFVLAFFIYGVTTTPIFLFFSSLGLYLSYGYGQRYLRVNFENILFLQSLFMVGVFLSYKTFNKFQHVSSGQNILPLKTTFEHSK